MTTFLFMVNGTVCPPTQPTSHMKCQPPLSPNLQCEPLKRDITGCILTTSDENSSQELVKFS